MEGVGRRTAILTLLTWLGGCAIHQVQTHRHARYFIPVYHRYCEKIAFYVDHVWDGKSMVDAQCFQLPDGTVLTQFPLFCGNCNRIIHDEGRELYFDFKKAN